MKMEIFIYSIRLANGVIFILLFYIKIKKIFFFLNLIFNSIQVFIQIFVKKSCQTRQIKNVGTKCRGLDKSRIYPINPILIGGVSSVAHKPNSPSLHHSRYLIFAYPPPDLRPSCDVFSLINQSDLFPLNFFEKEGSVGRACFAAILFSVLVLILKERCLPRSRVFNYEKKK